MKFEDFVLADGSPERGYFRYAGSFCLQGHPFRVEVEIWTNTKKDVVHVSATSALGWSGDGIPFAYSLKEKARGIRAEFLADVYSRHGL